MSLDISSVLQGFTTPPVAPMALPTVTNTQQCQYLCQNSIPPPRQRDSQPHATTSGAEAPPALHPITKSAAKDNKKFIKHLANLLKEFNETVQAAEQNFNLRHNTEGRMICMLDIAHHQTIYQPP